MNIGGTLSRIEGAADQRRAVRAENPLIDGLSHPEPRLRRPQAGRERGCRWKAIRTRSSIFAPATITLRAADARESLSLYTLGHIFEQSITELEYRDG